MPTFFLVESEKEKLRYGIQRMEPEAVENVFFEINRLEERIKQLEGAMTVFWEGVKKPVANPKYLLTIKR